MQIPGTSSPCKWIDTILFSSSIFWHIFSSSMNTNASAPAKPPIHSTWLLLSCAAMNWYLLGAACLLLVVAYPLLGVVANDALSTVHGALTRRLGIVFILPEFLAFVLVLPLFYWRPAFTRASSLWACVGLGIVYFVVTFGGHLPAHELLALGDASALPTLLVSHVVRTLSLGLKCGLLTWMIWREIRR